MGHLSSVSIKCLYSYAVVFGKSIYLMLWHVSSIHGKFILKDQVTFT